MRVSRFTPGSRSLDDQLRDCRELCERQGLEVAEVYREEPGTSAFMENVKRPVFDRMLDELRQGTVVVCWALDRLTRKGAEQAGPVLRLLGQQGAHLKTVSDGIDTERDQSELNFSIRAALARDESFKTSQRSRRGHASRKREGKVQGRAPYGLVVADGHFVRDPERFATARRIAEMFLEGKSGYEVCRILNDEGIPARGGKPWQPATIVKFVTSPSFAGFAAFHRRVRAGKYADRAELYLNDDGKPVRVGEGVVTFIEWRKIVEKIEGRKRVRGMKAGHTQYIGKRAYRTMLGGLIWCGLCGGPMAGTGTRPDGTIKSYGCTSRMRAAGGKGGCEGTYAAVRFVDHDVAEAFLTRLAALEPGDELLDAVAEAWTAREAPDAVAELAAARETLEQAENALGRLDDDRADGIIDRDGYVRQRKRLVERRDAAMAAVRETPRPFADISPLLDTEIMGPAWAGASLEQRREYLGLAIDRVIVYPVTRRGVWDPNRVEIVWREACPTSGSQLSGSSTTD